jgi:hypothetical protein
MQDWRESTARLKALHAPDYPCPLGLAEFLDESEDREVDEQRLCSLFDVFA